MHRPLAIVLASVAAIAGVVGSASPALADRHAAISLAATLDARSTGETTRAAGNDDVHLLSGPRVTLSFESAAPPMPPRGRIWAAGRLAPELFVGYLADSEHAEGYVGAGLRAELWLSSHRRAKPQAMAIYVAARGLVIEDHRDGASELAFGEFLPVGHRSRVGWEGGVMARKRGADGRSELDTLLSIYVGWR